jgi:hypothetical protein
MRTHYLLKTLVIIMATTTIAFSTYFTYDIAYTVIGVVCGSERCISIRNSSHHAARVFYHYRSDDYKCIAIEYPGQENCIGHAECLFEKVKNEGMKPVNERFIAIKLIRSNGSYINLLEKQYWKYHVINNTGQYLLTINDDIFNDN